MYERDYGMGVLWLIFLPVLLPLSLFIGNIVLLDALIVSVTAGLLVNKLLHVHSAVSMVIGVIVLVAVYKIYRTDLGFRILGSLFTLAGSGIIGMLVHSATGGDLIWGWFAFGLSAFIMGWLHYKTKDADALDFLDVLFFD